MKWVARKVKAVVLISFSAMAQQMEAPSSTEVPRPSSSTMTKEVDPKLFKMNDASFISTMNVEALHSKLSTVLTLEKIESQIRKVASSAGTKHPIWAMT